MNRFKSKIKKSWSEKFPGAGPFPFAAEFPENSEQKNHFAVPEFGQRCAGVVLIITMITVLGQIWGDPRFSTVQQSWDVPRIQQSIPLIRDFLLSH